MPSNNVFQYSKIRTRKRSAKKSIKTGKKMESSSFWNPESTVLESGIQYPESGIHSMESRIQDCPGFPYMGRIICQIEPKPLQFGFFRGLILILLTPSLLLPRPRRKSHLHQGISVYPPNTYWSFLMTVIVWFFPSHLLWKVLAAQPWVEACQHRAQLLSFPIAGERNCVTTVEITSNGEREKIPLIIWLSLFSPCDWSVCGP